MFCWGEKLMNHEDSKTPSFLRKNARENEDKAYTAIPAEVEKMATSVVDSAFSVHKNMGAGLLESVYETCFCYELQKRGLKFERQVILPIFYDGVKLHETLRLDVLVENQVICEIKDVDEIAPIHQAQLLTYLKLAHKRLGFLINFNVPLIKHGIKRIVL
jgi:GxxExxY protein